MNAGIVQRRDVFISHASEDKEAIARPLAQELRARGCSVWFDEYELELGDSLRAKVGDGLRHARVGVVILSRSFFAKRWPRWELDGLTARQLAGEDNVILPVLHEVGHDDVRSYSPPLADLVAAKSSDGVAAVADRVVRVLKTRIAGGGREAALAQARTLSSTPVSGLRRFYRFLTTLRGVLTIAAICVVSAALVTVTHPFDSEGGASSADTRTSATLVLSSQSLEKQIHEQFADLKASAGRTPMDRDLPRLTIASDLHTNVIGLPALEHEASGGLLLFAGDLTDHRALVDETTLLRVVRAGTRLVFVSGEHDSDMLERKLARSGAIVLTRSGRLRGDGSTNGRVVTRIAGLRIAGYDDPLKRLAADRYRDNGPVYSRSERRRFATWLPALRGRVDIVMVHAPALARPALAALRKDPLRAPLLVVEGDTHQIASQRYGPLSIVNAGSLGFSERGGGIGFGRLLYSVAPTFVPRAADLVQINPENGQAQAIRHRLDVPGAPDPISALRHCENHDTPQIDASVILVGASKGTGVPAGLDPPNILADGDAYSISAKGAVWVDQHGQSWGPGGNGHEAGARFPFPNHIAYAELIRYNNRGTGWVGEPEHVAQLNGRCRLWHGPPVRVGFVINDKNEWDNGGSWSNTVKIWHVSAQE
jgi:predicted phosphodiesterase